MIARRWVRRLVCRLRGHDDVVGVVAPDFGAAVLECDRCGRRRLTPLRCTISAPEAAASVAQVDRGALELLQLAAAVNGALARELLARLRREGDGL